MIKKELMKYHLAVESYKANTFNYEDHQTLTRIVSRWVLNKSNSFMVRLLTIKVKERI